jgi:redox-sensitive bicupin YhaK (pirin superfamily)
MLSTMSWRPAPDPTNLVEPPETEVEGVIEPRDRDLGDGFVVRRLLPAPSWRAIGPFVFFDHFGPTELSPGKALDVRPHPHINLATVTYLFEGEILHRDSLGSRQPIRPGDVNWMTAGRGIVHSERTDPALRASGSRIHGLQLWLGLPREHEEVAPAFHHHPESTLPVVGRPGSEIRVLVGEAFGQRSPVRTFSRVIYLDVRMDAGAALELPADPGGRAVYLVEGRIVCDGQTFTSAPARMLVLRRGRGVNLCADAPSRLVLIGGDPFPEPRYLSWNFVSSSRERIEQARRDWREHRGVKDGPFPLVPGDETEFIPLPDR